VRCFAFAECRIVSATIPRVSSGVADAEETPMAELDVTRSAACLAWRPRGMVSRTASDNGTTDELDVTVTKPLPTRVEIRWGLDATLVKFDDSNEVSDLLQALQELMNVAASAGTLAAAGTPPTPQSVLDLTKRTITGFDHLAQVFSAQKTTVPLGAIQLPVTFTNRNGKTLNLRGTIVLDAHWMTDEPDDLPWSSGPGDGNFAWFETENFSLATQHQCAATGNLDVEAPWKPNSTTVEAHQQKPLHEQGVKGRVFMLPTSGSDRFGFFPKPLISCSTQIDADSTNVTFDLSMNAQADDLMLVVCRSVTLILELFEEEARGKRRVETTPKKKPTGDR
jgi:hypothetical protein